MAGLGRILLADHGETFLQSTVVLLRRQGYQCDCTLDAATAVQMLRSNGYDLLIAGIEMPRGGQYEAGAYGRVYADSAE